ncbi:MAG: excinuclease ABC subunit UvrC [Chloroflexi bacterium]|nr:excinuclease ABC subunit UvrC [Chloroflexota bacterium]
MDADFPAPHLQDILDHLPTRPGVYLMKDTQGQIIYVGKAVNLRSRVRSYFQPSTLKGSIRANKIARLVDNIADIEVIVVDSELEALLTEINLIKAHQPFYNVRLKDDKRYPYIKVHWQEDFPKVTVTRRVARDGARYFGPYTNARAVYETLDVLRKAFPYLTCDREISGQDERACLYYDIKLCNGPCIGAVNQEEYRATIQNLMDFLKGKSGDIMEELEQRMNDAAEQLNFERAARLRDQLQALDAVVQRQKVVSPMHVNQDVIAFAREENDAVVQIFFIRAGKIIGREHYVLEGTADENEEEIVAGFMKQFYEQAQDIPPEVLLPHELEEAQVIETWLRTERADRKVVLRVPQRGQKRELIRMASENAAETLGMLRAQWQADTHKQESALNEIQTALGLAEPPNRIECFDISNTQGTAIVASRVVFVRGVPRKSEYRKFNIRSVTDHGDDYASMREALDRRFSRWLESQDSSNHLPGKKTDPSWQLLPDLLIIDGGKGQLGVAVEVLKKFDLFGKVPVVGLAKQREELFQPGESRSILLQRRSQGLYLIQRIRDEAHRFAITHHRKRRTKMGVASQIDSVPGVGPARRKALLQHFGSLKAIREASEEELATVPGISSKLASIIKAEL